VDRAFTNSGALRNKSGVTTYYGQIILGANNTVIYSDSGSAFLYDGNSGRLPIMEMVTISSFNASGTGNVHWAQPRLAGV